MDEVKKQSTLQLALGALTSRSYAEVFDSAALTFTPWMDLLQRLKIPISTANQKNSEWEESCQLAVPDPSAEEVKCYQPILEKLLRIIFRNRSDSILLFRHSLLNPHRVPDAALFDINESHTYRWATLFLPIELERNDQSKYREGAGQAISYAITAMQARGRDIAPYAAALFTNLAQVELFVIETNGQSLSVRNSGLLPLLPLEPKAANFPPPSDGFLLLSSLFSANLTQLGAPTPPPDVSIDDTVVKFTKTLYIGGGTKVSIDAAHAMVLKQVFNSSRMVELENERHILHSLGNAAPFKVRAFQQSYLILEPAGRGSLEVWRVLRVLPEKNG